MIKTILIIICTILFVGCSTEAEIVNERSRGELRHKLFVECMELAAKMPRKGDDDVSDIIDSCSSQGYYMANQMMK